MTLLKTLATTAAFALTIGAGAAFADTPANGNAKVISIAAVDLSNPAEVDALQIRIVKAARRLCRHDFRVPGIQSLDRSTCIRQAVDRAVADAGSPALSVLQASLSADQKYVATRAPADAGTLQLMAEAAGQGRSAGTIDAR